MVGAYVRFVARRLFAAGIARFFGEGQRGLFLCRAAIFHGLQSRKVTILQLAALRGSRRDGDDQAAR